MKVNWRPWRDAFVRFLVNKCLSADTVLVKRDEVQRVQVLCTSLTNYIDQSGALNDPHRVRARRRIERMASELQTSSDQLEVGA